MNCCARRRNLYLPRAGPLSSQLAALAMVIMFLSPTPTLDAHLARAVENPINSPSLRPTLFAGLMVGQTPPAPTNLSVTTIGSTWVKVAWTNPPGPLTGSGWFVGPTCGNWTGTGFISPAAVRATITNLTQGTHYCIAVTAFNSTGQGELSGPVTVMTGILPLAPTNLTITTIGSTWVKVAWTNPPGPLTGSGWFVGPTCGNWTGTGFISPAAVRATITNLTQGTHYCIAVTAFNSTGQGELSESVTATTENPGLDPVGLVLTLGLIATVVVLTYLFLRPKRKGKETQVVPATADVNAIDCYCALP